MEGGRGGAHENWTGRLRWRRKRWVLENIIKTEAGGGGAQENMIEMEGGRGGVHENRIEIEGGRKVVHMRT